MDYIKLAQRTIAMLSSMIESGECHTTQSKEMKDNALNGLEQLRIHGVVGSLCDHNWVDAKNAAVKSGQMCVKCHSLKA